jgi:FdhD protein
MPDQETHAARPIVRINDRSTTQEDDLVIVEEPLEIRVNGEPYVVVMRTPGHEMELAAGFCLTEGVVDAFSQILSMGFCSEAHDQMQNVVNVIVSSGPSGRISPSASGPLSPGGSVGASPLPAGARALASRSSCGICGIRMIEDLDRRASPLPEGGEFPVSSIVRLQHEMSERQAMWRLTGGAHAAALAKSDGEVLVVREDVGRHNALDKAIGFAGLHGMDCSACMALLSGRISFEMVQKAVRAQIPVVIGVSAATSLSVDLAERLGCTLVGRLRGPKMVIYTHPERIVGRSDCSLS